MNCTYMATYTSLIFFFNCCFTFANPSKLTSGKLGTEMGNKSSYSTFSKATDLFLPLMTLADAFTGS